MKSNDWKNLQFAFHRMHNFPLFCCYSSDIYGGYLCFVVSIFAIGVVTAVIGDVASHFGCTLSIKDSVTAIVFVALGTSVPGLNIVSHFIENIAAFVVN